MILRQCTEGASVLTYACYANNRNNGNRKKYGNNLFSLKVPEGLEEKLACYWPDELFQYCWRNWRGWLVIKRENTFTKATTALNPCNEDCDDVVYQPNFAYFRVFYTKGKQNRLAWPRNQEFNETTPACDLHHRPPRQEWFTDFHTWL